MRYIAIIQNANGSFYPVKDDFESDTISAWDDLEEAIKSIRKIPVFKIKDILVFDTWEGLLVKESREKL